MAIAALVLWLLTAGAGVWLLSSGQRAPGPSQAGAAAAGAVPASAVPGGAMQAGAVEAGAFQAGAVQAGAAPALAAVPLTADGRPPPATRTKVVAPPGEHPLLEFSHPALAAAGLAFWLAFTLVRDPALAWISLGILAATLAAGAGWLIRSARADRRHPDAGRSFPPRLIALHGLAAATVIALSVLTALTASHG